MRTKRLTEDEYRELKYRVLCEERIIMDAQERIEREKQLISETRKSIAKIKRRLRWYDNSKESDYYKEGFCYKMFGKRAKDLSDNERREYRRMQTAMSRARSKS